MTENRITELFGINPASSVPLRTQLERKLEYFINSSAPGTVIPSERVMAKCLGISTSDSLQGLILFFMKIFMKIIDFFNNSDRL
jgi:hypothetical protein